MHTTEEFVSNVNLLTHVVSGWFTESFGDIIGCGAVGSWWRNM